MKQVISYITVMLSLIIFNGCSGDKPEKTTQKQQSAEQVVVKPVETGQDKVAVQAGPVDNKLVSGKIVESTNASGYTYVLLDRGENEQVWAAIPATPVELNTEITIEKSMEVENFEAKALGRTFERLIFANRVVKVSNQDVSSPADATIEKAAGENSYTISEIFGKKSEMEGQTIVVRAKVVKILNNIMGKNWIHLQDGTGDMMFNSQTLVAVTTDSPEKDSVITVQGVVYTDKDFGFGRSYPVVLEDMIIKE